MGQLNSREKYLPFAHTAPNDADDDGLSAMEEAHSLVQQIAQGHEKKQLFPLDAPDKDFNLLRFKHLNSLNAVDACSRKLAYLSTNIGYLYNTTTLLL